MPQRYAKSAALCVVLGLFAALPWRAFGAADDSLNSAYSAILRGDFAGGRAELRRRLEGEQSDPALRQVDAWLSSYQTVGESRAELREKSLAWNVEQAQAALSSGRTYLALTFALQGYAYAQDEDRFRAEPWVSDLRAAALRAAEEYERKSKWTTAATYYARLERMFPKDDALRELRKRAATHARLELIYKDRKAVEKRIKGVRDDMLGRAMRLVEQSYYEEPDFRKMALVALDHLEALCNTRKLYDVFDGVANTDLREHFLGGLERLRRKVRESERFGYRDMLKLFLSVDEQLNRTSIDLPQPLLVVEFLEGALGALDDFTSIIWPSEFNEFEKAMIGHFKGVGIQLGVDESTDRLKVVTPLENSPALEAGIQPGDLIIEVDGESTKGWTTEDAVARITGEEGTKVVLTMFRPQTEETLRFPLVRRAIHLTTVRGVKRVEDGRPDGWDYMLDPQAGVAYVRLTGFNPDSQKELDRALETAREQGMRGLILDLRNNPGGLLNVAVSTVGTFLRSGEVVSTRGRAERGQRIRVDGDARLPDLPLVVLVNEASASASEILAGALQDQNRAAVLGERTFGKGSVQNLFNLADDARLKLTTALYYLPSGRTPHRKEDSETWGVDPDWQIRLTPKEFSKVIERETRAFIIHNETRKPPDKPRRDAGDERGGDAATPSSRPGADSQGRDSAAKADEDDDELLSKADIALLRSDPYEAPDVDPQVEMALLQMRVKLATNLPWPRQLAARSRAATGTP